MMHSGQPAEGGVVFYDHMAAKKDIVGHGDSIAKYAVVGDMAACHQQVPVSNDRVPAAMAGAQVDGHAFTNGISIADENPGVFTLKFLILGIGANNRAGVDLIVLPKDGVRQERYIVVEFAVVANTAIWPYVGEGADLDI
tara:strand:- start:831 stop:1250 length:420 start_codon:yes stop_codon:yes gene_type:complete